MSTQAVLTTILGLAAVVVAGPETDTYLALLYGAGLVVVAVAVAHFSLREKGADVQLWRPELNQNGWSTVVALGVPLVVAVLFSALDVGSPVSQRPSWGVGVFCVAVIPTVILVSSSVDTFYVIPRILGLGGPPAWETPSGPDEAWRRRLMVTWMVHRTLAEFFVSVASAFALALALVGLADSITSDPSIPSAIESLGGASVAFGIFGFFGPRVWTGVRYVLAGPVGMGQWIVGADATSQGVAGLVVDVSVAPGIKIISGDSDLTRHFIPLRFASDSSAKPRPDGVSDVWCRARMLENLLKRPVGSGDSPGHPGGLESRFGR